MRYFILVLLTIFIPLNAIAAEEVGDKKAQEAIESKRIENPHVKDLQEKAASLTSSLSKEEAADLVLLRENFGIVRSIQIARDSVKEAVGLCSKANPDLSAPINKRFDSWNGELGDELDSQEAKINNSINKENFKDPKSIKVYFKLIDDVANFANDNLEKNIVTSVDACTNLMNSMDETQETITKLLKNLSWFDSEETNADESESKTP